jgi:2,3-dihydroxybiphenyl 1,2-dioxygenase
MEIKSLAYMGIYTSSLDEWTNVATRLLGLQQVEATSRLRSFRMDDCKQRLMLAYSPNQANIACLGWSVDKKEDLDALAGRLENNQIQVMRGPRALATERFVSDLITFDDPDGNRCEVVWDQHATAEPFRPGRAISGFVTGPLGMGHVVLHAEDINVMRQFYCETLGFRVSDYVLGERPVYFLHINGRHHTLALIGSGLRQQAHHLMLEVSRLDDVGHAYDIAEAEQSRVAYRIGRHFNDHMTSFYIRTPSNLLIEYGWGGLTLDPETWVANEETDGPSSWGHERVLDPLERRIRMRELAMEAAARGHILPDPDSRPRMSKGSRTVSSDIGKLKL